MDDRPAPFATDRRTVIGGLLGAAAATGLSRPVSATAPSPTGIPQLSEIIISIRSPAVPADAALVSYRPSRVEWHYVAKPAYVHELKSRYGVGYVSGTINAVSPLTDPQALARDFDGNSFTAPFMENWGTLWKSVASPATRAYLLGWVDQNLAAGCDGVQVDDGWMSAMSADWGGDFSDASLAGFGPWLSTNVTAEQRRSFGLPTSLSNFDYRVWLHQQGVTDAKDYMTKYKALPTTPVWKRYLSSLMIAFWQQLRSHLDSPRHVPLSMNYGAVTPSDHFMGTAPYIDYTDSELPSDGTPSRYRVFGAAADAAEKRFVGNFINPPKTADFRQQIAVAYASGAIPAIPWDLWMPNVAGVQQQRLFPAVDRHRDIYEFVRAHPQLIDGYRTAGRVAVVVPIDRYSTRVVDPMVETLTSVSVPFRFVMTGGTYTRMTTTADALAEFSVLLLPYPIDAYDPAAVSAMKGSGRPMVFAANADFLARESIGSAINRPDWSLVVRQRAGMPTSNLLHIVPTSFGVPPFAGTVRILRDTPWKFETSQRMTLYRPGQPALTLAPYATSQQATLYRVPSIGEWGVLAPA